MVVLVKTLVTTPYNCSWCCKKKGSGWLCLGAVMFLICQVMLSWKYGMLHQLKLLNSDTKVQNVETHWKIVQKEPNFRAKKLFSSMFSPFLWNLHLSSQKIKKCNKNKKCHFSPGHHLVHPTHWCAKEIGKAILKN